MGDFMKNRLVLGTVLLSAASFFWFDALAAPADNADSEKQEKSVKQEDSQNKPQLIISGAAGVHSSFGSPKNTYYKGNPSAAKKASKDTSMTRFAGGEANIAFEAKGALENGLRYGAVIDVDSMKGDTGVDKMYIILAWDNFGTIHFGNVKGPDAKCVYSGQELIDGTCGVDGTIPNDMDYAAGVISPVHMIGYTSKATKLVYYSPRIAGFQFAASITPDTKMHGHANKDRHAGSSSNGNDLGMFVKNKGEQKPSGRNNIVLALSHFHNFENGLSTKVSGVYLMENTRKIDVQSNGTAVEVDDVKLRNARSYHLSATVGYKQFSIGAGFINNGRSRTPKVVADNVGNFLSSANCNAGRAWNVGAKYEFNENWAFSTVFHHTQRKVAAGEKTKGNMLTAVVEYKVCDGLLFFLENDFVSTRSTEEACKRYNSIFSADKDRNAIRKQRCNLIVLGAKVSF